MPLRLPSAEAPIEELTVSASLSLDEACDSFESRDATVDELKRCSWRDAALASMRGASPRQHNGSASRGSATI